MKTILKLSMLSTAILLTTNAFAAGFQVSETSATGLGRAYSGDGAVWDNASSMARNPALITHTENKEISIVASHVAPNVDIKHKNDKLSASDIAPNQTIPNFYYTQKINEKFYAGLGIYSNYGTGTEYDKDYLNGIDGGKTHVTTISLTPTLAYKFNEHVSIGAGANVVYSDAEMKRYLHVGDKTLTAVDMKGNDIALGWVAGLTFAFNENHSIGLSYKSKVKTKLEGDFTGLSTGGKKVDGSMEINLPSILELSTYDKITKNVALTTTWMKTDWSSFGDLVAKDNNGNELLRKHESYKDSERFGFGLEYEPTQKITLRLGYAIDTRAGYPTLSIPDTNRFWYTTGGTYKVSKDLSLDMGLAYVKGQKISFTESKTNYTSESDAYIVSGQLNYKF